MYKSSLKSIIVAFFAMCLVICCPKSPLYGQKSIKGKWTKADKTAFSKEFRKEMSDVIKKDETFKTFNVTDAEIAAVSDCCLVKIEAAYSLKDAGNDKKNKGIEKITEECTVSILLGEKGAWSPKFREMMKVEMNKNTDENITAAQQAKLTECIISKAEKEIAPSELANSGEAMAKIGTSCGEEIITK